MSSINTAKMVVKAGRKAKVPIWIWGSHGNGKSDLVKQIATEESISLVDIRAALCEAGDFMGLPYLNPQDFEMRFAKSPFLPKENDETGGILFLDELNRAHPDIIQAMFSFITEGTIHTHKLPEGWSIVAAGNYQSNAFNVSDTSDAAWMSRFCHIDFTPSKEEFCLYAEDKGIGYEVAKFIRAHSECLEVTHKERLNYQLISPDRRAWLDMIAKLDNEPSIEEFRYEVYSGIVGQTAASSYLTFKKKNEECISGRDVLFNYDKVREKIGQLSNKKEARFDMLNTAVEEMKTLLMCDNITEKQIDNLKSFILEIPLEMGLKVIKILHKIDFVGKNSIINDKEFVTRFKRVKL